MSTAIESRNQTPHRQRLTPIELSHLPFPTFFTEQDCDSIVVNDLFRPYIDCEDTGQYTTSLEKLESMFGVSLKQLICNVIDSGARASLEEINFSDCSGFMRCATLHLIPTVVTNDGSTGCAGILVDRTKSWRLSQRLNLVQSELSIVSQVSAQLGATMEAENILKIVLIAVTAREGLGFNRAFVFLVDENSRELVGCHAIGPINAEEAGRIWGTIPDEGKDLRSIIRSYRRSIQLSSMETDRIVRQQILPFDDKHSPLANSILSRKPIRVTDMQQLSTLADATGRLLCAPELAIAPLYTRKRVLGVIAADNLITGRRISETDLEQLQMFASQAATALERAHLYENLQSYTGKIEKVNRQLEETQKEIIRMEKLSLMGEMTYRIAHELRNPLTVIGGFAGLLVKSDGLSETAIERAEIIQKESRRIEKHLDILLDFSKSYSQECESVDLNMLARDVVRMVEPAFLKRGISVQSVAGDSAVIVQAHKDLLLHGLYNVVGVLGELSPKGALWRLISTGEEDASVIEVLPDDQTMDRETAIGVLKGFVQSQTSTADLRLALANEAISYNGGHLGCELHEQQPRIYMSFQK